MFLIRRQDQLTLIKIDKIFHRTFTNVLPEACDSLKRKSFIGKSFFKFAITASLSQSIGNNDLHSKLIEKFKELSRRTQIETYFKSFLKETIVNGAHDEIHSDYETLIKLKNQWTINRLNFALIGSILIHSGSSDAWKYIKITNLSIRPHENETDTCLWGKPKTPLLCTTQEAIDKLNNFLIGYEDLKEKLKYQFKDVSFLLQAVTHPTFIENDITHWYKPLDFIGDAVIEYIIVRHLCRHPTNLSLNEIVDLCAYLLNDTTFATIVIRNKFHEYARYVSAKQSAYINSLAKIMQRQNYSDEIDLYFRFGSKGSRPTSFLPDIFESIAGAIFLDSDMQIEPTRDVYLKLMEEDIEKLIKIKPKQPTKIIKEKYPSAVISKHINNRNDFEVTIEIPNKGNYKGIGCDFQTAHWSAARNVLLEEKNNKE